MGDVDVALTLVALATVALAGTALSDRLKLPAPLLLITLGVAGAYLPGLPTLHLEAEVVLFGLLPPLLYTAARETSLVDFTAQRKPILLLSVALVVVTTVAVGAVAQWLVPSLGWPAALAIGAVVAPPDAVAATAIARRIGLPREVVTVLEGESLLNDATALVCLRTAIAAIAGTVSVARVGLDFLVAAGGGALAGFLVFWVVARLRRHITDPLPDTALSLITPYAAFLLAESVHASGVIAVVVAGILLGHKAPLVQTAPSRIAERTTWRAIAYVLENAVFLLIGLQAHWIIEGVAGSTLGLGHIVGVCAAVLATVVLVRLLWVAAVQSPLLRRRRGRTPWSYGFLVGWAGMRGVVTLAAAFLIPSGTPHREVLLLVAFTVVAGTLFLQGLTLPWLTRRLDVPAPDPAQDALARATLLQQAGEAGLARLDDLEYDDPHGVCTLVRRRIEERNFAAWERLGTAGDREAPSVLYARVRLEMLQAERSRVLEARSSGLVPSEVVSEVLAMLDIEESIVSASASHDEEIRTAGLRLADGDECPDLAGHPARPAVDAPGAACQGCLDAGQEWVALRRCLDCGQVGCCDSSAGRHATAHFHASGHPVMQSAEPGELWRWCYLHHRTG